ncbi:long-chain-fatty-acid--CoA ligase [Candidimonas sp. SYP-B2681]|uniref:long-chain-fatty-acid--CoA ligase n=1 Tax=Candidimonas sp. SYP-B2681 TaxID=2497686 RepID=UPI000F89B5A8|nr:long-chain-fatty-acid--CoA ligase [Candidimonas sp. SYP-B2681]RTZ48115.1 long-chain-fatty-acid--CoA ligase [Candidimonas sp. SYP-B2681]
MMHFPLTLNWLRRLAERMYGTTEVVTRMPDGGIRRHCYAQIAARSQRLARRLAAENLQPGETVGTLMWNHHVHLEAYFGVPAAGGVLHTINHRLSPEDQVFIINHAGDKILIVDDVLLPQVREILPRLTTVEKVIVNQYSGLEDASDFATYEAWLHEPVPSGVTLPEVREDSPASICYTGGSTGRPKGVVYSHRGLVMHAFSQAMVDGYGVSRNDTVLAVVPMFHGNGWGLPFSAALTGAKLVLPGPKVDPQSLLELMHAEEVTFSAGVPTVWQELASRLEESAGSHAELCPMTIITGGAAPPQHLFDRLARFGITLLQGWGMTETASVITVSRPQPKHTKAADQVSGDWRLSQGKPMAIVDIRIMSEGKVLPHDGHSIGEVQVRGVCVTDKYFELDLPSRWTEDGWLCTGDIGHIDPSGNLKVLERKEDLIKSGGEWIAPQDLEDALLELPEVIECTVIAIPHEKWGERPLALMVLAQGATVEDEALRLHLLGRFAKWQLPQAFVAVASIPRTAVGKIARRQLREEYADWSGRMTAASCSIGGERVVLM